MSVRRLLYKIAPFLEGEKVVDANHVEVDSTGFTGNIPDTTDDVQKLAQAVNDLTVSQMGVSASDVDVDLSIIDGVLNGISNVQQALNRLDALGFGDDIVEITSGLTATIGNKDTWFGGKANRSLRVNPSANNRYTFTLPDPDTLNNIMDDLNAAGLAEQFTITISYTGGSTRSVSRNALVVRAANVSPLFDPNELPATLGQGDSIVIRFEREAGGSLTPIEVLARGTIDTAAGGSLNDIQLQAIPWNAAENAGLPTSGVLEGYAYRVINAPIDGSGRFGEIMYTDDWVVWNAATFDTWTNTANWFVIAAHDVRRLTLIGQNFLQTVNEADNRVDVGLIEDNGAADGLVWLSPVLMDNAPFLDPNTDTNNPRANADGVRYVGGTFNRNSQGLFQYGSNFFDSQLYLGITPSYVINEGVSNIDILINDDSGSLIQRYNLDNDFTQLTHSDFTNGTVNHYLLNTSFNYPSLGQIGIVLTQVNAEFTLDQNVELTPNVSNIQRGQLSQGIQDSLEKIDEFNPPTNPDFSSLIPRISTLRGVSTQEPYVNTYFAQSTGSDGYPNEAGLTQVSAANPRFQVTATNVFIFVEGGNDRVYLVKNITQDTNFPLDRQLANVELGSSLIINGISYFGYRVSGITASDILEIDRVLTHVEADWEYRITNNEDSIARIDVELEHAALNLSDELVQVLDNEVTVTEEDTPTVVPSDYNQGLSGDASGAISYDTNAPVGSVLSSSPIIDNNGNDKYRKKLLYVNEVITVDDTVVLRANDGGFNRQLIRYNQGKFYARQFVASIPAGSSNETVYPAQSTRVSGAGIWQTIAALTFQNGIPVAEADEIFFTRNLPLTASTLTIQYRGHANGNIFGASSTTLANVGGGSETETTFILDDGGEQATVEVRYYPNFNGNGKAIRVSVTERVNSGLPTINDVEVILSFTETRTVPSVPETIREVFLANQATQGSNVFAIKPSVSGTVVIESDSVAVDSNYAYTTAFAAGETGTLQTLVLTSNFFDYRIFEPSTSVIQTLENYSTLPQFGLFTTEYTHETVVDFEVQLQARGEQNDIIKLGQELVLIDSGGDRWRLSVNVGGALITTKIV